MTLRELAAAQGWCIHEAVYRAEAWCIWLHTVDDELTEAQVRLIRFGPAIRGLWREVESGTAG
jgi:hypothetical protein